MKRSQDFPPLSCIKGSKRTKLRQTNQIISIWEDRGGLCHFNRGTMGDQMLTIDFNGGTGGPLHMEIFFKVSYKRLKIRNAHKTFPHFLI